MILIDEQLVKINNKYRIYRIYTEHEEMGIEEICRLYVTDIEVGDGGNYTCQRMENGDITDEKVVSLLIFSECVAFSLWLLIMTTLLRATLGH